MDWEKIKQNWPLAFKSMMIPLMRNTDWVNRYEEFIIVRNDEAKTIHFIHPGIQAQMQLPYHRRLYDYFDRCGIYVNSSSVDALLIQIDDKGKKVQEWETGKFKDRNDVEYQAFEKAFEWVQQILEKRLADHENEQKEKENNEEK